MAVIIGSCFLLTSCATMARGRTQRANVSSEPQGALIYEGKDLIGITPTLVILDRKNPVLRFEKEGFSPREVAVKRELSGWIMADVAAGVLPSPGTLTSGTSSKSEAIALVGIFGVCPPVLSLGLTS
jgi:hypothetical protein